MGQVKALLEEILERVTDEFNLPELMAKVEERSPYVLVALQECERMNTLTREVQRSLRELALGLKVRGAWVGRARPAGPLEELGVRKPGSWRAAPCQPSKCPARCPSQNPGSGHVAGRVRHEVQKPGTVLRLERAMAGWSVCVSCPADYALTDNQDGSLDTLVSPTDAGKIAFA